MTRMRSSRITVVLSAAVVLLLLLGCATGKDGDNQGEEYPRNVGFSPFPPEWIEAPPEDTEEITFFIGHGRGGSQAAAQENAVVSITDTLLSEIGITISPQTSLKTRNRYDDYRNNINDLVKRSIEKSWSMQEGDKIRRYLLAAVDKAELELRRRQAESLFSPQEDAVAQAEERADFLFEQHFCYHAGLHYVKAAVGALGPQVTAKEQQFIRNITKAAESFQSIELERLNNNLQTYSNTPFSGPLLLQIYTEDGAERITLPDVAVTVRYRQKDANGNSVTVEDNVVSNQEGIVSFQPPSPQFLGRETVTMELDIRTYEDALRTVPEGLQSHVALLREVIEKKSVRFTYISLSRADVIPTGIYIVEVDRAGNRRDSTDSASGVLESLRAEGFQVEIVTMDVPLQHVEEEALLSAAEKQFGGSFERLIYGVIGITNFSDSKDSYTVEVSGTLKVAELGTKRIVYRETNSTGMRGSDIRTAMSAAFKGIGREFGESFAERLP